MAYDQLRLRNQLCFRLYTASRLITQTYYPLLDALGITYPQYLVMMALWEEDGLKVMELAHRLSLDSNTVTPLVKRMAALGLVRRQKGKQDGRETFVFLTPKGKKLEEQAKTVPSCIAGKVISEHFQMEQVSEMNAQLDTLIAHLAEQKKLAAAPDADIKG